MLAADGLRSLMLMKLFPLASATHIHILAYCDEQCFDFGPWPLSVMSTDAVVLFTCVDLCHKILKIIFIKFFFPLEKVNAFDRQ